MQVHAHTHTHTHTVYYHSVHAIYTVVLYMCEHTLLGTCRPVVYDNTQSAHPLCTATLGCDICVYICIYVHNIYIDVVGGHYIYLIMYMM